MPVLDRNMLATAIVTTLQKRGPLPLGYLAWINGRQASELLADLEKLKQEGVIRIDTARAKTR